MQGGQWFRDVTVDTLVLICAYPGRCQMPALVFQHRLGIIFMGMYIYIGTNCRDGKIYTRDLYIYLWHILVRDVKLM